MTKVFLAAVLASFATPLLADTIPLSAPVTAATLYSQGATVTREVPFSAPAGRHELLITNLPVSLDPYSVRVAVDGATLGSVTVRNERVLPDDTPDSPALIAAKDTVKTIEDAITTAQDGRADVLMRAAAATARITYLASLTGPTDTAASPETLLATVTMIGRETLSARQEAARAERDARSFVNTLEDLAEELDHAQQVVAALAPPLGDTAMLSIAVTSVADASGTLTLTHLINDAAWLPAYDVHLTDTADKDASLRLDRGAFVSQNTGEDWRDVALTLSTSRPDAQISPSGLHPWLRRIEDPEELRKVQRQAMEMADTMLSTMAAPLAEPVTNEYMAAIDFGDGINATYAYPSAITLSSDADALRVALDTLTMTPTVFARANPSRDDTAFLMAEILNESGELILPSHEANYYLNGTFIGNLGLGLIAQGDTADLPFGPINGLRLTETLLERNIGDSGVITTRNDHTEKRVLTVDNLTRRAWDIRMLAGVPYSEQEDLQIAWQARPMPTTQDLDGDRGILEWERALPAGETFNVDIDHQIKWPSEMILR